MSANERRAASRTAAILETVHVLVMWGLVVGGYATQNPWLFAVGALLLVLDAIEESR